jgi:hypothetical protein
MKVFIQVIEELWRLHALTAAEAFILEMKSRKQEVGSQAQSTACWIISCSAKIVFTMLSSVWIISESGS